VTTYPVQTRRWTRKEYHRLAELGVLREDEPIELIGGQLIVAEPKGTPHATMVEVVADVLRGAFGPGWAVRAQNPIALDDDSEPEPDVFVVPGRQRDYLADHPSQPVLVVEVADSSLALDRRHKGSAYARAGITDYWIVNLVDRVLEVYRQPVEDAHADFGWSYADVTTIQPGAAIAPLARLEVAVAASDLVP